MLVEQHALINVAEALLSFLLSLVYVPEILYAI